MGDTTAVATPVADDGLLRTIKDLVAGAAGGVTQVMAGTLWVMLHDCACGRIDADDEWGANRSTIRYCESANADTDAGYECIECGEEDLG